MLKRVFGKGSKTKKKKKRLSPTNGTAQGLAPNSPGAVVIDGVPVGVNVGGSAGHSSGGSGSHHPGYQYALNEFAQTVAPATGNDDGRFLLRRNSKLTKTGGEPGGQMHPVTPSSDQQPSLAQQTSPQGTVSSAGYMEPPSQVESATTIDSEDPYRYIGSQSQESPVNHIQQAPFSYKARQNLPDTNIGDATYEEWYGDAYTGGPIKYIYPSGYQSMRPRGGPWKLSIFICLIFTWLSVFVIGHCSDRVDQTLYDQAEIDDDALVMETRWCGSRLLYMMWVVSMLITGMAAAYCGVIGYIKIRDFAVANSRSQPPGYVGKSDYYVQLQDQPPGGSNFNAGLGLDDPAYYEKSIYQADGNPQFWGQHIYRPTQAAVAITSR